MNYSSTIVTFFLLLYVNLGFAQFGAIDKSFSDYGITDVATLKDEAIARMVLEEPFLHDFEKQKFFEGMQTMDREQVQGFPALILRYRLRPFVGVHWDNNKGNTSTKILKITKGTTAEKAKIKKGDIIIDLNDCPIKNRTAFMSCFSLIDSGAEIAIGVLRKGKRRVLHAKLQNRIGTYQAWEEDLFLDLMLGHIKLEDFNKKEVSLQKGQNDALVSILTSTGKNYQDLMVAKSTFLLDTLLSKELMEDIYLTDRHKKLLFKEIRDFRKEKDLLIQRTKKSEEIPLARRSYIRGQMLKIRYEPKLGISLKFDPIKKLPKIVAVEENSCADDAGILVGDYLKSLEQHSISSDIQFFGILTAYRAGDSLAALIERDNKIIQTKIKLKNYWGSYEKWTEEIHWLTFSNNYDLKDYQYLKDKKYIRDTSLWNCPIKQVAITSTLDLERGYLPLLSCKLEVIFNSEEAEELFLQSAEKNSFRLVLLAKRDKLMYGGPKDPLYISLPLERFEKNKTTTTIQYQIPMSQLFTSVENGNVPYMSAYWYFKTGFEFFDVMLLENKAPIDEKQIIQIYNQRGKGKYIFKQEKIENRTKKND